MKIPVQWLKQYAGVQDTPEKLADRLTMTGTEVEEIIRLGQDVSGVVVCHIESIMPHENADSLVICIVDAGEGEKLQIVTGAPNVAVGQKVPLAKVGAKLPGGFAIKRSKLRGVESRGMLCSGVELGHPELDAVDGILVLPSDAPVGMDALAYLGLNDTVLDCKAYANRPDCLSVIGVAREAAAALNAPFALPDIRVEERGEGQTSDHVAIEVEDPDLCPRYMARAFVEVKIGPSPSWMQNRLRAAGMRPINNVVDVTNYVMLEMGQPLHAFDRTHVRDARIVVRRGRAGETLTTLDGKVRTLTPDMLVIADGQGPVALAGIMGGENSGIGEDTRTVLLESAKFLPTCVRATSRALGLRTESSARFEKGVDIEGVQAALDRAAQLMEEMGAAKAEGGCIDICAVPSSETHTITVDTRRIDGLLGIAIDDREKAAILKRLQIPASLLGEGRMKVCVPSFRGDIQGEADIAEELIRIHGYEHIPVTLMRGELVRGGLNTAQQGADRMKAVLAGAGFQEIVTFSFMGPRDLDRLRLPREDAGRNLLPLQNPIGEDQSYMRNTLLPGLLDTVAYNTNRRTASSIMLFEMAKTYHVQGKGELPREIPTLALACWGTGDFFDLKGVVDLLAQTFGLALGYRAGGDACWHPGRRAEILLGGRVIGQMGEIHEETAKGWGIEGKLYACQMYVDAFVEQTRLSPLSPLPKFPAVERDLAVTVKVEAIAGELTDTIENAGGKLLTSLRIFDVYRGAQLGEGLKSIAWALAFQGEDRTLTDGEVDAVMKNILSALEEKHGAKLRN